MNFLVLDRYDDIQLLVLQKHDDGSLWLRGWFDRELPSAHEPICEYYYRIPMTVELVYKVFRNQISLRKLIQTTDGIIYDTVYYSPQTVKSLNPDTIPFEYLPDPNAYGNWEHLIPLLEKFVKL
jgi:hypothetical protein